MPITNRYDQAHLRNLTEYQRQIDKVYRKLVKDAVALAASVGDIGDDIFSFDDFPQLRKRVNRLLYEYQKSIYVVITNGIEAEWTLSNNKNSELTRIVFGRKLGQLTQAQRRQYFNNNHIARKAFIARRDGGLNLSDRVWNYSTIFKNEIELALDIGIRSGMSAATMTRSLRQYLKNPDKLFRRVRDEHGELKLSKAAKAYNPGAGVYRSSYKNARRLAATETNMAYRTADFERWQQLDFVVGIEIKLSNNHTTLDSKGNRVPLVDICDDLAGRYPKDFKFVGWHPHCRCFAVTILKTQAEMERDNKRILAGLEPLPDSVNTVKDVPWAYQVWIRDNANRIRRAKSTPYFIADNPKYSKLQQYN